MPMKVRGEMCGVSIVDANDILEGIHGWGRLVYVNGRTTCKGVCVVGAQRCAAEFASGGPTMWGRILLHERGDEKNELWGCGWIRYLG